LHQNLTSDAKLFASKTNRPEIIISGLSEASLLAVMYAAVDSRMGWAATEMDSDGTSVRKIIVLITDQDYSNHLIKPGPNRKVSLGDGKDTCEKNLLPQLDLISKVLQKQRVSWYNTTS